MNNRRGIENKAQQLWGKDLHKERSAPIHCSQLEDIFNDRWRDSLKGDLLEIGCGGGSDLEVFSKNQQLKTITAIDLGENIENLAEIYKQRKDINLKKGNALSLDFDSNRFDVIYSFGIFHHTSDPIKCISEANRVLRKNGVMFLYLYSSHENSLLKRIGIFFEKIIMKTFQYVPYSFQNIICVVLSPFCWVIFSIPSRLLGFCGISKLAKKFPFYFGTHPFSLIPDLKDRLMSPINHRFTKLEIEEILQSNNFSCSEVVDTSSGLYIYSVK
jgi:2-polyprenyl-3-methyl-5-hydroxy-6-metoxy-1,4-benzoquinol methylase